VRDPGGATQVAAVIGSPVRHSLSPAIHNAAFAALGIDWVYVAFEVAPGRGADALAAMRALQLRGLSVTMPHKEDVAATVDEIAPAARALRAVNCVERRADGTLVGHNTDGDGFVDSLVAGHGVSPSGRRCTVLGAGGAARAVVDALARAGATDVCVVNRSADRAETAAALAGAIGRVGSLDDVTGADLVVNATSIGMGSDDLPFDPALLRAGQTVADLVYHPLETALLRSVRAAGAVPVDGLGMLVHQAARQLRIWTGLDAPVDTMRAAALVELARR
jgi:shikimate dehydrogenase